MLEISPWANNFSPMYRVQKYDSNVHQGAYPKKVQIELFIIAKTWE